MPSRCRNIPAFLVLFAVAASGSAAPPHVSPVPPAPMPRPSGPVGEPDYPGLAQLTMVLTTDPVEQHRIAAVEQMARVPAEVRHVSAILNLAANRDPSDVVRHAAKSALTLVQADAARMAELNALAATQSGRDRTLQASRIYREALVSVWKSNSEVEVASAVEMPRMDFFPDASSKPAPIAAAAKWSLPELKKVAAPGEPKPVAAARVAMPMPKKAAVKLPPIPTSLEPVGPLVLSPEGKKGEGFAPVPYAFEAAPSGARRIAATG